MGYGDDILASGLAKKLLEPGKRAAFGDGRRIIWGPWSEEIFRCNPKIARPGEERKPDIQWIDYYKGHRLYNAIDTAAGRWRWNYAFHAEPGEIYFDSNELAFAKATGSNFILIEPNVPWKKSVAPNKDWGPAKYQAIVDRLKADGHDVVQTKHGRDRLVGVRTVSTPTFRAALAVLSRARLAILPEGGLHHGAAALGIPAVVLFGGFIPPSVTGYSMHINLTGDVEACGSLHPCKHCRAAMDNISVEQVYDAARYQLATGEVDGRT